VNRDDPHKIRPFRRPFDVTCLPGFAGTGLAHLLA